LTYNTGFQQNSAHSRVTKGRPVHAISFSDIRHWEIINICNLINATGATADN